MGDSQENNPSKIKLTLTKKMHSIINIPTAQDVLVQKIVS